MLTSKVLLLTTTIFAIFSFYTLFYSIYQIQLKFEDTSDLNLLSQGNSITWFKPKTKVVFIIIDGLRFDNLLKFKSREHEKALDKNKFRQFNRAYFANPERYVVFRTYADLPTMTVLRVPCMMTGNVPRLGSVLTAFGALPATEDSIPRQLYLHGRKSYFAGDPILPQYFPKYLTSDYTIGAFNMRDRFVDDPSHSFMNKKLKENDFDFLGGHFLEVDHAGHHSGLATKRMKKSIANMDKYLMEIINQIDDDTILLFAGDHGLTIKGSHGGGSHAETDTAIVAYHKRGFMKNRYQNLEKVMRSINETDEQVVNQIDIVPTLSMLMGLPIPFSNMGQILNDLYPVGDYMPPSHKDCPETDFLKQILHDNHLNTLQIWNYFRKYYLEQNLYTEEEFSPVARLFYEIAKEYKTADDMIKENRQCEKKFHDVAIKAIQKSQKLAKQIHDMVSRKPPHDLVIFWQAFFLLVLVGISYILQVQYLYKTKDYEYSSCKNWKTIAKRLIPLAIPLCLVWLYMLAKGFIIMRPITSTGLVLGMWIFGSFVISLLSKSQEQIPQEELDEASSTASEDTNEEEEESELPSLWSKLKSFVSIENSLMLAGAVGIFAYLFYLTHVEGVVPLIQSLPQHLPYICVMTIAARFCGQYFKFSIYIIGLGLFFCFLVKSSEFWTPKNNIIAALVFLGDWLLCEMQFTRNKLKSGKIWSYQYIASFLVLVGYHYVYDPKTDLVQIYLPRVIWAILLGSILLSFIFKMPWQVIKRNIQINLVLFLILMQVHRKLIYFGITLSIMRILTFIFKRTSFKNYLYPLILGLISYIALWAIGYDDHKLPRRFGPAFVGLRDFHLASCLLLFSSAMLSTIILAMLFMSFYSQDLKLQAVQLGVQPEEETGVKAVAIKGDSEIIRKRNILFFCLFYCLLMIGAAVDPIVMERPKAVYRAMETFLVDGAFYLFTIGVLYVLY